MAARASRRAVLAGAALVVAQPGWAASGKVAALVIGVGYQGAGGAVTPLRNAVNDARLIAETFKGLRIQTALLANPSLEQISAAVDGFARALSGADTALLYFAGHGVQVDGQNYIVTEDGETLVNLVSIIESVRARARSTVVFLDACRNNPFADDAADPVAGARSVRAVALSPRALAREEGAAVTMGDLGAGVGLAKMDLGGVGVRLMFATDVNNVASDGAGANGPFAIALARRIREKVSLDEVLTRVTVDVNAASAGTQNPWQSGSLLETPFLAGKPPAAARPEPFRPPG